jgi:hypothetical protein
MMTIAERAELRGDLVLAIQSALANYLRVIGKRLTYRRPDETALA